MRKFLNEVSGVLVVLMSFITLLITGACIVYAFNVLYLYMTYVGSTQSLIQYGYMTLLKLAVIAIVTYLSYFINDKINY